LSSDSNNISFAFSGTEGAASYCTTSAITCGAITIKRLVFRHKFVHFRVQRAVASVAGSVTEVTWFNNRSGDRYALSPSQRVKDTFHSVNTLRAAGSENAKSKCKVVPVLNELNTTPWRSMGERMYRITFLFYMGTSLWWVVCLTPRQLYTWEKSPWYPVDRKLNGRQYLSGRYGKVRILVPTGIRNPNPRSSSRVASFDTDCATAVEGSFHLRVDRRSNISQNSYFGGSASCCAYFIKVIGITVPSNNYLRCIFIFIHINKYK
jgi:hypothetical protein